jgi:hypothetical protein
MGLWAKSIVIFNAVREHGKKSIQSLADHAGLSKRNVLMLTRLDRQRSLQSELRGDGIGLSRVPRRYLTVLSS